MAEKYKYEKRSYYPHMMPYDVAIWERFIEQNPDMYDFVSYDVKVGSLPDFDTVVSPETGGDVADLYKRKIDVVGFKGDQIDIIEIGPNAGSGKLGQVLGYKQLYIKEFQPSVEPKAIVLTDALRTDMNFLAESMGVFMVVA